VAFELQVVAAVPLEPHDQRLDVLVTEKGVTRFSRTLQQTDRLG
jgi:5-formyltetrahydrofolate cyclo-ligase